MALHGECCFLNSTKAWWMKFLSYVLGGGISPLDPPLVKNVVCYELVCYKLVCYGLSLQWTWSVMYWSVTNWSAMDLVCNERGLLRTGLLWTAQFWTGAIQALQKSTSVQGCTNCGLWWNVMRSYTCNLKYMLRRPCINKNFFFTVWGYLAERRSGVWKQAGFSFWKNRFNGKY